MEESQSTNQNEEKVVYHKPIPTVSDHFWDDERTKEHSQLKPMDMCYSNNHPYIGIGVVLMGPINIPHFEDGCASAYAYKPLDIQNPEEWQMTYPAYIVFDLDRQKNEIVSVFNLKKLEIDYHSGYIPFDHGTASMRVPLGLIEMARKAWKKE